MRRLTLAILTMAMVAGAGCGTLGFMKKGHEEKVIDPSLEPRSIQPPHPSTLKHVLYFTRSAKAPIPVVPYSRVQMLLWGRKYGKWAVEATDDCADITAENLEKYDCVVFYTDREIPLSEEQRQALLDYVYHGGGFVAVNSALRTFTEWKPYVEMTNGTFDGAPWNQRIKVTIEQPEHPIMCGVPKVYETTDTVFQFTNWNRNRTHVLASLDISSVDLGAQGVRRNDKDFALAWAHRYGRGRVYCNALGGSRDTWASPPFELMMAQGIAWASKELPEDLPPGARAGKKPSWRIFWWRD